MSPGTSSAPPMKRWVRFRSRLPESVKRRIRHRARAALMADADRRWLLALGQNESEEAAGRRQPEPRKSKRGQTVVKNEHARSAGFKEASFLRYGRANE